MPRAITQTFEFETVSTGSTRGTVRQIANVTTEIDDMGEQSDNSARQVDDLEGGLFNLGDAASFAAGGLATLAIEAGLSALTNLAGDVLGVGESMNLLEAQTGKASEELGELETISQRLFAREGLGDSFDEVAQALSTVSRVTGETGQALEDTTRKALIMSETFGADITESVRAADTAAEQFGISTSEAMDLLFFGIQQTGDPANDLLDTFNEYSGNFAEMGLTAEQALALLSSSLEGGARNTDDAADALREFQIRLKENPQILEDAFEGMDDEGFFTDFEQGFADGADALGFTLDMLRQIEDPIERNAAGVALFGTRWEDMGEEAFLAMSLSTEGLENFEGATDRAGDALQRGPQQALDRFMRTMKLGLANALGPFIERGFNLLADVLDDLPGLFDRVAGAIDSVIAPVQTLIAVAQQFGLQSPQFFGFLTKFFGPETAADIKRVTDALAELDFNRLADELFNNLLSGAGRLGAIINDQIIQPVVDFLRNVDWSAVASRALELYTQLLKIEFEVFQWVLENIISPIADAIGEVDWATEIDGALDVIIPAILTGTKTLSAWATSLGARLRIEINNIDWSAIQGVLDDILGALLTGAVAIADLVGEHIIEPIKSALSDETEIQNIATEAGKLVGQIAGGMLDAIGDINQWTFDNIIKPMIDALLGEAAGEDEDGVHGGGKSLGQSVLDGIASVFSTLATAPIWFVGNIVLPFVEGLTGVDFSELLDEGKRLGNKILEGIASTFDDIVTWVDENIFVPVKNALTGVVDSVVEEGKAIGQGIIDGMEQGIEDAFDQFTEFFLGKIGGIVEDALKLLGIASPSKVFAEIGQELVAGLAVGVSDTDPAERAMSGLAQSTTSAMLDSSSMATSVNNGGNTLIVQNLSVGSANEIGPALDRLEKEAKRRNMTILQPLRGAR
jgi:hypothetical protein